MSPTKQSKRNAVAFVLHTIGYIIILRKIGFLEVASIDLMIIGIVLYWSEPS